MTSSPAGKAVTSRIYKWFQAHGYGSLWRRCESHSEVYMLPPIARQKMHNWIRSRHLICSGNFFLFETVEYSTIDRFEECLTSLGGALISVEPIRRIWIGNHRQVILYQAKASLHTPHHELRQYWFKYGGLYSKFDERC